jgi:two-component system response regulator DctR
MERKIKILAIDDERDILYTLQAIGRTMGWDMTVAADGLSGVEKLRRVRPNLVLLDYHMPNQDGLRTVQAMRSIDKSVPIIVLTVDERQEIADKFLLAGASDFATKPIKVPDLVARIKVHLQCLQQQRDNAEGFYVEKGINDVTLQLVRGYCISAGGSFYIGDVAKKVGLAYQTTVRYLHYLLTRKELNAVSDYGRVGRPRNKYQYCGDQRR